MVSWNEAYATKGVNPDKCDYCSKPGPVVFNRYEGRWLCESCDSVWYEDEEVDDVQVDQR